MRISNSRPLVFLGTCLAFAETTLGALAGLADADATIVAVFAMASLGMVLLALVMMYWRDPAFLTLTGEQLLIFVCCKKPYGGLLRMESSHSLTEALSKVQWTAEPGDQFLDY